MAKTDDVNTPAQMLAGLSFEQIKELVSLFKDSDADLEKKAKFEAAAMKRVMKPENENHPGISVYNPQGERDHPKPPLKAEVWWCGFDERNDVLTIEENMMLNFLIERTATEGFKGIEKIGGEAKPCTSYVVKKTDGTDMTVYVSGMRDSQTLLRLEVLFATRGEHRHNLPSKIDMLEQMLGLSERASMLEEIARLRKQLETKVA